jgi:MoaA/NifB/PqqE/SkfB family radical SAM enzyme
MIFTAHIGLSYICNMNCKHCFVSKENDINFNYKEILDKLYDEGVMVLYYTYGEPLLWSNFYCLAKYATEKNFSQILMTNGSMIVDEYDAKKIKETGIKRVYISIDSIDSKKHDDNRNYIGAYDKAINAIKILKQSDFKVGISCAVNNNNVHELYEIYRLGMGLKVDYISFLRTRINRRMCSIDDARYKEELLKILKLKNSLKIQLHDFSLNEFLKEVY